MDISKLSTGAKVVLGAGLLLLLVSFFSWFEVDGFGGVASMWEGFGFIAGLALLALLAWEIAQLAGVKLEFGISPALVSVTLAILVGVIVLLRVLVTPGPDIADDVIGRTFWAWIGLLLALVVVAGAVMGMQAAGKTFSDMRGEVSGAVGSRREATQTAATTPAPDPVEATPATPVETPVAPDEPSDAPDPPRSTTP